MTVHFRFVLGSRDANGDLRIGAWKLDNSGLYRLGETHSVKQPRVRWKVWRRVL